MKEVWKDLEYNGVNYTGYYRISTKGKIMSLPRNGTIPKQKLMKFSISKCGYLYLSLHKNDKTQFALVHRLVLLNFSKNLENKETVNHINGIKTDNRIENLEWATQKENIHHSMRLGLKKVSKGETQWMSKLTEKEVLEIRECRKKNYSLAQIKNIYPVSIGTISLIINRITWKHI